jgi:pimeloyl-ACP methyl ester carboxylesterase/membrane protein DedA with SNARE-associated domain
VLGLYAIALVVSSGYRWANPPAPRVLGFNEQLMQVQEVLGDGVTGRTIRLAYFDYTPRARPDAPVVVLLHGSPGSAGGFAGIMPQLSGECPPPDTLGGGFSRRPIVCPSLPPANAVRVIAPYLPGYGHSENTIADYSFRAHAYYLRSMLDTLGIQRAHFVGYSMGGGPSFNLEDIAPERVASITLLSSLGVQEFELMGDYHLNRIVHGIQLVLLWALESLTPHFGALDAFPGVEYGRNFFESDQRPLRGWMQRYEKPMLVLHGLQDAQVPPEAAAEHVRIVPQSEELLFPEGGHGIVFSDPQTLAGPILDFVARVESGRARIRSTASPQRVAAAAAPIVMAPMIGVATFSFYVLVLVLAILVPELGAAAAGALLAAGRAPWVGSLLACVLGVFLGELIVRSFARAAGRRFGVDAQRRFPYRVLLKRGAVEQQVRAFQRSLSAAMIQRFWVGARMASYLAAGSVLQGWRAALKQLAWMVVGSACWAVLATGLATLMAWPVARWLFPTWPLPVVLIAAVLLWALGKGLRVVFQPQGARA